MGPERAFPAGVDVEYRNHDSLIHGFLSMAGVVREARRAFGDAVVAPLLGLGVDGQESGSAASDRDHCAASFLMTARASSMCRVA